MGIPGAGKSTFCKKYFSDYGYVNLDTLRENGKEEFSSVRENEYNLVKSLCVAGENIIVDNTNCKRSDRLIYFLMAMQYGYKTIGYYFKPNLKDSLRRNRNRSRKVPEDVIREFRVLLLKNKPSFDEGFDELYIVNNDDKDFQIIEF